jgi:hypothetical protein
LVSNQVSGKVLRRVDQASDCGTPKVGSFNKIEQRRLAAHVNLDLDCSLDHSKCVLGIRLRAVSTAETLDGLERFLVATATHEPPRRLWREKDEYHQWKLGRSDLVRICIGRVTHRKDPLKGKGTTPCPHIGSLVEGVARPRDDDATN